MRIEDRISIEYEKHMVDIISSKDFTNNAIASRDYNSGVRSLNDIYKVKDKLFNSMDEKFRQFQRDEIKEDDFLKESKVLESRDFRLLKNRLGDVTLKDPNLTYRGMLILSAVEFEARVRIMESRQFVITDNEINKAVKDSGILGLIAQNIQQRIKILVGENTMGNYNAAHEKEGSLLRALFFLESQVREQVESLIDLEKI